MNFALSDEQNMLRDMVRKFVQDRYDFESRQKIVHSETGWDSGLWKAMANELGILGAPFSQELGGYGGGCIENMIVMEELGYGLAVDPFVETVVIAGGLLKYGGGEQAADLIGQIISGDATFAFAHAEPQARYNLSDVRTIATAKGSGFLLSGHKAVVTAAPWASHLIVTARTSGKQRDASGISLFAVPMTSPGIRRQDYATVDGRRASEIWLENVELPAGALVGAADEGLPLIERVVDEAIAAIGAEAVGIMRKILEDTIAYSRQREQFGVPISSFQVLRHRMVDMFVSLEQSASMMQMATQRISENQSERAKVASAAKVQIGKSCRFVGQSAIQIHGGIGVTDDLAVAHYFKRATMIESQFGSVDHHLRRFERLNNEDFTTRDASVPA